MQTAKALPKGGVPNAANLAAAAAAAQPAPVAAAPVAATTNPLLAQVFTLQGAKAYNVRPNTGQDNARSWQAIQQCIQANGGQATRAQLNAAVAPFNHLPMVGYCIRRGWVVPVQAQPAAAPTTPAPAAQ